MNNPKLLGGIAIAVVITAIILKVTGFTLGSNTNTTNTTPTTNTNTTMFSYQGKLPDDQITNKQVHLHMTKGDIVFSLDSKQSPIAVSNFVYLTGQKYYDGILWHRVEDWVTQVGDPQTKDSRVDANLWGTGGPGYTIPDETVTGEYKRGTVAMAKTAAPNSAGSQIFILKADYPLPKTYQIIGQVTSGIDVVDKLERGDQILTAAIEPAS
jgi:cyclophilin family peptidyl-prolyl cis-trans isomerase